MFILITYDVCSSDEEGPRRLRKVAKICLNYGIRVQKSVFECKVTPAQRIELEDMLVRNMNQERDSIRIYEIGNNPSKIKHLGTNKPLDIDGVLMF